MNDIIKRYRVRRKKRLLSRMDEEDGQWVTTKEGNKIHISEEGVVDKGNPHVMAGIGAPKGVKLPEGKIELKESEIKLPRKLDEGIVNAISSRQNKECIFGGYYRVKNPDGKGKSTSKSEQFFNPYTGEHFSIKTGDYGDSTREEDFGAWAGKSEIESIPINDKVQNLWDRANGRMHKGAEVVVNKGRTVPVGTKGKVVDIYPVKNSYGTVVADYAVLDSGEKINVNNLVYADEYKGKKSSGSKSGKGGDGGMSFEEAEGRTKSSAGGNSRLADALIDKDSISSVISKAKTEGDVTSALKTAGYSWKKTPYAEIFDIRINKPNGEYIRIYQKGTGRKAEFVVQDWTKPKVKEPSVAEISSAKNAMSEFVKNKMGKAATKTVKFGSLSDEEKHTYVMIKTYAYARYTIGLSEKEAIRRAVDNANYSKKDGYSNFRNTELKLTK